MKYNYLFATDMDFTLLLPGQDVPEENLRACKALKENKIALTISTGRSSYLVGIFAEKMGIDVPLITGNGGALFDPVLRKHIYSADFTSQKAEYLIKRFIDEEIDANIYGVDGIYFLPKSTRHAFCEQYNEGLSEDKKAPLIDVDASWLNRKMPDFNKFLVINPPEELDKELRNDPDLEVVSSGPSFMDVMAAGVSKGNALLKLADYLEIPRTNTFAIGDSENDISMIAAAQYGISMGNGSDACKKAAKHITASIEEDGFAKAVFEYVIPLTKSKQ